MLQAGLTDERRQWEEELTDGGTLLRLADNGDAALDDAGRALVRTLCQGLRFHTISRGSHLCCWWAGGMRHCLMRGVLSYVTGI